MESQCYPLAPSQTEVKFLPCAGLTGAQTNSTATLDVNDAGAGEFSGAFSSAAEWVQAAGTLTLTVPGSPCALSPHPSSLSLEPHALRPAPSALNPISQALNPEL